MKKILILGPDYFHFISAVNNAFHALGCQTYTLPYLDYSFLQKCVMKIRCKSINTRIERKHKSNYAAKIKKIFQQNKPSLVFIINADFLDSETIDYMRNHTAVAIWLFDNISKMPGIIDNLKHCEHIFSFDKNDIQILEDTGLKASFLPQACDVKTYFPIAGSKKDIDILFVGNLYFYPNRQKTIQKIIEAFPERKIKVIGEYKPWYKGMLRCLFRERRDIYTNHNVSPEEVNKYYNQSRIVLNIHREDQKNGANPRLFEICGSGAYQISDSNPYIKSIFPHREIGLFKTEEELIEAISDALTHDKSSNAQAAHEIVVKQHTYESRMKQVFQSIIPS